MCGRYASARQRAELLAEFGIERDRVPEPLPADYNVAPTKPVYAVLTRIKDGSAATKQAEAADQGEHPAAQGATVRELRVVRWGLVPSWAKDPAIGSRLINARAETVDSKPAFRQAFARRRCLLPADGFYEWQENTAAGRTRKQPYFIHRGDGGILAFAGLYEIWRNRELPEDHPHAWLWTATIITTRARDDVGRIHDRMPMVIPADGWADWLDPVANHPADLLAPALSGGLASYPVSTEVNSVRNNGPQLIEPLADSAAGPPPQASGSAANPGSSQLTLS